MNDPMPAIRSILGMPPETDPIEDLLTKALHAHLPEDALAAAQIATARAIREQTEQLRIANKLKVSLIEQLGELARATSNPQYAMDPRVDIQGITPDEWAQVGL